MTDPLRFVDVLTTANAVTSYLGDASTTPAHVTLAIAILRGEVTVESLGRPRLSRRVPAGSDGVSPELRDLVQRWFASLGGHGEALFTSDDIAKFLADLDGLESGEPQG